MKDLIISLVIVALLISGWLIFFSYSENSIDGYRKTIEKEIIPLAEDSNWDEAYSKVTTLSEQWHKYKKIALFFLDTDAINEVDYSLARSTKYVKQKDASNATGELNSMVEQLTFLNSNNKIVIANIF